MNSRYLTRFEQKRMTSISKGLTITSRQYKIPTGLEANVMQTFLLTMNEGTRTATFTRFEKELMSSISKGHSH
jgi:hypothetical protein